jgi:hypothetical protein
MRVGQFLGETDMPIKAERIEVGIYCCNWIGKVTPDDLYTAGDEVAAMAAQDGIDRYVLMITNAGLQSPTLHLPSYMGSIKKEMCAILVLNAPYAGEVMGKMFNRMMPIQVEFFREREVLLKRARKVLTEKVNPVS